MPIDRSGLNPLADLRLIARYRRLLKQIRPAAFLGFTIKPNIYGAIAARSLGIPVIANISGLGTVFIKRGPLLALVTRLYRFALSHAAVVFFQNPDDQALFLERGIVRPEQARLIPGSGIDVDRFQPAPLPEGPPVFLLIARLLGDKGVREFVAAARSLRTELRRLASSCSVRSTKATGPPFPEASSTNGWRPETSNILARPTTSGSMSRRRRGSSCRPTARVCLAPCWRPGRWSGR